MAKESHRKIENKNNPVFNVAPKHHRDQNTKKGDSLQHVACCCAVCHVRNIIQQAVPGGLHSCLNLYIEEDRDYTAPAPQGELNSLSEERERERIRRGSCGTCSPGDLGNT